ncbi:hypothetical protein C1I98_14560 [Spongiactinospora gelatinilytica]|uniref:Uncharacterized protein n=1 Tax=Spongiactinospora gelatinilytica TaxID=2666298 RepID=A0A2W2H8V8_9ACTN|nr:hypothetical protein [Spongiactinospora gelatinilytica]PZG46480.1 hypothetical protein C1I98_14560 [Spongiactinospora gelatinilytica]
MDDMTARDRAHLKALRSTFSDWRIEIVDGYWHAARRTPPTPQHREQGVASVLTCEGPLDLAAALTGQVARTAAARAPEIRHPCATACLEDPPPAAN